MTTSDVRDWQLNATCYQITEQGTRPQAWDNLYNFQKLEHCLACPTRHPQCTTYTKEVAADGHASGMRGDVWAGHIYELDNPPKKRRPKKPRGRNGERAARDIRRITELRATGASWTYIRYTVRPHAGIDALASFVYAYAPDLVDDEIRKLRADNARRRRAAKKQQQEARIS